MTTSKWLQLSDIIEQTFYFNSFLRISDRFCSMSSQIVRIGKILSISKDKKGFTRLVIGYSELFRKLNVTFCLWDDGDLSYSDTVMNVGDIIEVTYRYNGKFSVLIQLKPAPAGIIECQRCFMYFELKSVVTRSRLQCPHCKNMDPPENLIQDTFKLSNKQLKSFKFSKGLCLIFIRNHENYYTTVFKNSPFYNELCKANLFREYKVTAMETSQYIKADSVFHFMELFDLVKV